MPAVPSVAELRKICHKENSQPLSKYIIRPYVAIYLTRLFLRMGIPGDAITVAMGLIGVAGALCFLAQGAALRALACLLMLFAWILDHVDGQMLVYQKQSSALGILLDRLSHVLEYPLMHLCLGWSLAAQHPQAKLLGAVNGLVLLFVYCAKAEVKLLALEGRELPKEARRRTRSIAGRVWGLYRGTTTSGYGPYVLFSLLAAIAAGLLWEYFVFLSFSLYLNFFLSYANVFRAAHRARRMYAGAASR